MPSEIHHPQELSSSFFSEEVSSRDKIGFSKTDAVHNFYGMKPHGTLPTVASSLLQRRMQTDPQMVKGSLPDSYPNRDKKVNPPSEKLILGPDKAASLSLPEAFEHHLGSASYFTEGDRENFAGSSYEHGIFSSSLSELFTRKMRLVSNNTSYGCSVGAPNHLDEEEPFESLEELEAQTIGNLLPDDDDLFSGVTDRIDSNACPIGGDDIEELDLFCSVGGLDLGEDGPSPVPRNPGAGWPMHLFPSELDQDVSGFYMQQSRSPPANLMLRRSGSIPHGGITPNVGSGTVPRARITDDLCMSPYAENAFHHGIASSVPNSLSSVLSMKSIGNRSNTAEASNFHYQLKFDIQNSPNFHPHSLPDCYDDLANGPLSRSPGNMAASKSVKSSELLEKPFRRVSSNGHSIELNENIFSASENGNCPSPGHRSLWSNSHHPQPRGMMWSNAPSFVNGSCSTPPQQLHAVQKAPSPLPNGLLPIYNHHVGSAPSANPSLWERRHVYAGESPDASVLHPGSLGSMRTPGASPHLLEFSPHGLFSRNGGGCINLPIPSKNVQLHSHNQRPLVIPARGQMTPMMSSFDSPNERSRSRRHEGSCSQGDNKKQFELDLGHIMRGEDKRTTLMIKNIPNKYTSKMLLAAIDERHRGTYDFLYLPIDFKNKCNVGYAFINMTDPASIVPFYHAFNGKKWEKFNSEKVATLAYGRIQGKAALIAHFQNSSLMNEDKRCQPILFHTDGPNAGDQVPFPMGANIRPRPSKNRPSSTDENNQEGLPNSGEREETCNGSLSSVSLKDLDC